MVGVEAERSVLVVETMRRGDRSSAGRNDGLRFQNNEGGLLLHNRRLCGEFATHLNGLQVVWGIMHCPCSFCSCIFSLAHI